MKNHLITLAGKGLLQGCGKKITLFGEMIHTEISNRLGWLDCVDVTKKSFAEINSFVEEITKEGFTDALLMGMGGSSLTPEVFRFTFGVNKGYLDLHVLDSTHPEAIIDYENKLDPNKTLYIVSTKSGGTVETMSFMKYFFTSVSKKLGREECFKAFYCYYRSRQWSWKRQRRN